MNIIAIRDAMLGPANRAADSQPAAPPLHPRYRPDIDGLRAVAVSIVIAYHAFPRWAPFGFVGVDVFFVISGFLISTIIMGNLQEERFSYFDFYSRRIRRIFPALMTVLGAVLAFGWVSLFPVEYKALGKHVFGGAAFISNFLLWNESGYFDSLAATKPLLHLWSLGIEEQYYIFWPLILSIAWRKKTSMPIVIVSIGAASFLFGLLQVRVDPVAAFYSPLSRIWELMIGSALAYVSRAGAEVRSPGRTRIGGLSSPLGAILLLTGFLSISDVRPYPGWWAVLPTVGSVLLIAGGPEPWVNRWILSNRWVVFIGKISYPLYLWHWPMLSFAQILYAGAPPRLVKPALLLVTFMLSWLTYRFIERPFRFGSRSSGAATPLVALATVIAAMGGLIYCKNGLSDRDIVADNHALLEQTASTSYRSSQCPGSALDVIVRNKLCAIYPAAAPAKTIALWGDSSTGAWLPVFLDLAKQRNYTVINLSHPSCPPILQARKTRFDYKESREYCRDGQMQSMAIRDIARLHPDLIVVIAAWDSYSEHSHREFITDLPDEEANAVTTKRTLLARVPETLRQLTEISPTVVFRSWPIMPVAHNMEIERSLALPWTRHRQTNVQGASVSLDEFIEDSRDINVIFDHLNIPRLTFFDPSTKICAGGACRSHVDGIDYYSDSVHISRAGAMSFRGAIGSILSR